MRKIKAKDRCVCCWDPRGSRQNATSHSHLVKAAREKQECGRTDEPSPPRARQHSASAQRVSTARQHSSSAQRVSTARQHSHSCFAPQQESHKHTHSQTQTQTHGHIHVHRHTIRERERERESERETHTLPANGPNDLRPTGHWPRDAANRCEYLRLD